MSDDLPGAYLMHRLDEVVSRFDRLDEKMDIKFGEYGSRIATTEADLRHVQTRIRDIAEDGKATKADAAAGRRWAISTAVAVVAIILPILIALAIRQGGI